MNKVIEYMAMGLPIVSFDLVEARVSAGDAAVYVPANDELAFARAIDALLRDPERRSCSCHGSGVNPNQLANATGSSRL